MAAHWYVVHVYSGSEKKVAESLREQAVLKNMEDKILEVMVPTENIVEIKKGSRVNSERKFFPGYVLVKMEMSDDRFSRCAQQAAGDFRCRGQSYHQAD